MQQINAGNVNQLGLAWYMDLDNTRGLESTPLFHDGVLYTSMSWSRVMAVDAASGKELWRYDPEVQRELRARSGLDDPRLGLDGWPGAGRACSA